MVYLYYYHCIKENCHPSQEQRVWSDTLKQLLPFSFFVVDWQLGDVHVEDNMNKGVRAEPPEDGKFLIFLFTGAYQKHYN